MNRKHYSNKTTTRSEQGISLIEVLISIVVMTFGLLGISGLMMSGVNNSTGSDLASRATQSANEIMDAMRANRENAANYKTVVGTKSKDISGTSVANADRKAWLEGIERLPGGNGEIDIVTGTINTYRITVSYANCIGTLSAAEKEICAAGQKRPISFVFQI